MEQQRLPENDPRYIAWRLFQALCAQYPDRYIALIQPRELANGRLSAPKFTASKGKVI
jgi:hypothetical protein